LTRNTNHKQGGNTETERRSVQNAAGVTNDAQRPEAFYTRMAG
jgi:hypothetical protein